MKDEFTKKTESISNILRMSCPKFLFVSIDDEKAAVGMQGTAFDLVNMVKTLIDKVREALLENGMSEKMVNAFIKGAAMTDEELKEATEKLEEDNRKQADEFIAWLEKVMKGKNDDSVDEADSEEDEEEESDDSDSSPDISARVDLHVHLDDADGRDDRG